MLWGSAGVKMGVEITDLRLLLLRFWGVTEVSTLPTPSKKKTTITTGLGRDQPRYYYRWDTVSPAPSLLPLLHNLLISSVYRLRLLLSRILRGIPKQVRLGHPTPPSRLDADGDGYGRGYGCCRCSVYPQYPDWHYASCSHP
jgi:hypothetical protein